MLPCFLARCCGGRSRHDMNMSDSPAPKFLSWSCFLISLLYFTLICFSVCNAYTYTYICNRSVSFVCCIICMYTHLHCITIKTTCMSGILFGHFNLHWLPYFLIICLLNSLFHFLFLCNQLQSWHGSLKQKI